MRNILFSVLFVLIIGTLSYTTKKNEVEVDKTGKIPIIKVWNPEFKAMCQYLAHKLEVPEGTSRIWLRPDLDFSDENTETIQRWFISTKDKEISVLSSDLPDILRKIQAKTGEKILLGNCHLRDTFFYSVHDLLLVTETYEEADLLAEALRR